MIPAAVLTQLRAAWTASLPDTATPYAAGHTEQPGGGWTENDTPGPPFPCRLIALGDRTPETLLAASPQSRVFYWLDYPVVYPGTLTPIVLTAQSAVRIGARTYAVQASPDGAADELLQRALVWRDSETEF